jgi:hypothetical protein
LQMAWRRLPVFRSDMGKRSVSKSEFLKETDGSDSR